MKKILAISGGVDSMVLFDIFRRKNPNDIVVAHFDHGTRPSSSYDAKFVERIVKSYGIPFELKRAELGATISEEAARYSRYEFLSSVAKKYNGVIYTAHHANDLLESMAINLARGTGWRGLAPFGNAEVFRPFLSDEMFLSKKDILEYASRFNIVFRQDPTNVDKKYLRNRLRSKINDLPPSDSERLIKIYHEMNNIKNELDATIDEILPEDGVYEREWFFRMPDSLALEILRAGLLKVGISATRPKIYEFLKAIREYAPKKRFNLPNDKLVLIEKKTFRLT